MITKEQELMMLKDRYNRLKENGKNVKSPGILRKLSRQIRNASMEK